ncbi:unnamed protein product [Meloidogyne enterolobii]|uniref:Uncharacterized protein n=1 Tax=Meloidogyne enterolobii TaxID=390850 RepID=A0ACB1AJI1_MELEN
MLQTKSDCGTMRRAAPKIFFGKFLKLILKLNKIRMRERNRSKKEENKCRIRKFNFLKVFKIIAEYRKYSKCQIGNIIFCDKGKRTQPKSQMLIYNGYAVCKFSLISKFFTNFLDIE